MATGTGEDREDLLKVEELPSEVQFQDTTTTQSLLFGFAFSVALQKQDSDVTQFFLLFAALLSSFSILIQNWLLFWLRRDRAQTNWDIIDCNENNFTDPTMIPIARFRTDYSPHAYKIGFYGMQSCTFLAFTSAILALITQFWNWGNTGTVAFAVAVVIGGFIAVVVPFRLHIATRHEKMWKQRRERNVAQIFTLQPEDE